MIGMVVSVLLAGSTGGCSDPPVGPGPEASIDATAPEAGLPEAGIDASPPDGAVPPDARVFDFCGEPLIKMPFDGPNSTVLDPQMHGSKVYYSVRPAGLPRQIWMFDVDHCFEAQLTVDEEPLYFGVAGDSLVFDTQKNLDTNCEDLFEINLVNFTTTQLFDTPSCESMPRTQGRYILHKYVPDREPESIGTLRVYDLWQDSHVDVVSDLRSKRVYSSGRISEKYVFWTAISPVPGSEGTDVFVYDLATGDTTQVEASFPRWQDYVFGWEDYIAWSGSVDDLVPPYHAALHDLKSGETVMLLDEDYAVSVVDVWEGLVAYNTSKYLGTGSLAPSDIEIYDIESRVTRRLTAQSSFLRVAKLAPPFLLMVYANGQALQYDLYVANLEQLGVLDANGRLIPGDGVLVFP
jgi:hypothetical protein